MSALRLDAEIEARIARLAHSLGASRAELARRALTEFLDRHEQDADFERAVRAAAIMEAGDDAERAAIDALAWRTIDGLA